MPGKTKSLSAARPQSGPHLGASYAELVAFMQKAIEERGDVAAGDDAGLTSEEWAKQWGISENAAKRRLRDLWSGGLVVSGRRYILCMDGSRRPSPVYRAKT